MPLSDTAIKNARPTPDKMYKLAANDHVVNGKPALEWVMERRTSESIKTAALSMMPMIGRLKLSATPVIPWSYSSALSP